MAIEALNRLHPSVLEEEETAQRLGFPKRGPDAEQKVLADQTTVDDDTSEVDEDVESSRSGRRRFFRLRPADDDEPEDWWFASTAIPLLAATIGPLANVLSVASIIGSWRETYDPDFPGDQDAATGYQDPPWEIAINAVSLACGVVGNLFLLFNFTRAVRYIVALPCTIVMWYLATGMLIGVLATMVEQEAPGEDGLWSQAFWYAVMAAALYMVAAMLLMVNMLGYFLGHYTQHFELTDEQRNLILQTMAFFIWLAGGAGVFARVNDWSYSNSLYFCDVTILTVGFGDYASNNNVGRGLVFPYSVFGIIMLGLVITSISKFTTQLGHSKIMHKRIELSRVRTVERANRSSAEFPESTNSTAGMRQRRSLQGSQRPSISAPFDPQPVRTSTIAFSKDLEQGNDSDEPHSPRSNHSGFKRTMSMLSTISEGHRAKPRFRRPGPKRSKILILKEERDRFNAMRRIQDDNKKFKKYFALSMSIIAFGVLWCVGAVVFWRAESETQQLSYFEALYFCYVSLLTIGYGDLSPKSNAGKPFFVVWSLIAVPTMTILVSDLGETVIASYKRGTFKVADWSIMPKQGGWARFLDRHPRLRALLEQYQTNRRIEKGFGVGPDPDELGGPPATIEKLATESLDEHDMAKRLALAIRKTADDLKSGNKRRYTYEEWVEFTRLIRFTKYEHCAEDRKGLIEWDWIGENSPMMADQHECEWVLDRLCESLNRYMHKMVPEHVKERRKSQAERRRSLMEGQRSRVGPWRSSQGPISPSQWRANLFAEGVDSRVQAAVNEGIEEQANAKQKVRRRSCS